MASSHLARPYAAAAFEYATAAGRRGEWSDMLALLAGVASDARVARTLRAPGLSASTRAELMLAIAGEHLDAAGRNLVHLLATNGRLTALPDIAQRYEALRGEAESRVAAHVTAAVELDATPRQRLSDSLRRRLERDIELHCDVDPALIGGAVIRAGDRVIDGSLRGRLARLSGRLAH
jgi:F-type H+-transporting ATPase subunit delta